MVNINKSKALELHNAGFKWSGHTYPGEGVNVRMPSDGDLYIPSPQSAIVHLQI